MFRGLLAARNLETIKKQARDLLHGLRRRDPDALRRYYAAEPETKQDPALDDARYVIAREYGFTSWRHLKEGLNTRKDDGKC